MKNRSVIVLSAVLFTATGSIFTTNAASLIGQDPTTTSDSQNQRQESRERNIFAGIDLTDEQKAQLKTIRQNEREQIKVIRNEQSLTQEEKKAKVEAILQASRRQSLALLTPEQRQTLRNRREQHEGRGDVSNLNLTDEQKASLKTIRQSEHDQIQAVRNNQSLSDDEKKTQIQTIRQNSRQQSRGVLTPEQQQILRDRRAEHGGGRRGGAQGGGGSRMNNPNGPGERRGGGAGLGGRRGGRP